MLQKNKKNVIMNVPQRFRVFSNRTDKQLSKITMSGNSKALVMNALCDKMRLRDIHQANHFAAEMVASGQADVVVNKLIVYASQEINMCNPLLPKALNVLVKKFARIAKCVAPTAMKNEQQTRNLVCEMTSLVTLSSKRPIKFPKIGELDLELEYIKNRIVSRDTQYAEIVMLEKDPKELSLPVNELANHIILQRRAAGDKYNFMLQSASYIDPFYWLAWFLDWERKLSSRSLKEVEYKCAPRAGTYVDAKFTTECVWIVWELLITLAQRSGDQTAIEQISSLFELYSHEFSKTRKNERKFLLYHAVQYIVSSTNYRSCSAYSDATKIDRMSALINFIYQDIAKAGMEWEAKGRNAELSQRIELSAVQQPSRRNVVTPSDDLINQNAEVIQNLENEIRNGGLAEDESGAEDDSSSHIEHDVVKLFEKRDQQYDKTNYSQNIPDMHKPVNEVPVPSILQQSIQSSRIPPALPEGYVYLPLAACNRVGCVAIPKHETSRCKLHRTEGNVCESRNILVQLAEEKCSVESQ